MRWKTWWKFHCLVERISSGIPVFLSVEKLAYLFESAKDTGFHCFFVHLKVGKDSTVWGSLEPPLEFPAGMRANS